MPRIGLALSDGASSGECNFYCLEESDFAQIRRVTYPSGGESVDFLDYSFLLAGFGALLEPLGELLEIFRQVGNGAADQWQE